MKDYPKSERLMGLILEDKAKTNKGKVFVRYKDQEFTYDQINEKANRVGNGFLKLGIKKGDKVGIMLPNCLEYLDIWFGLSKIGAVEVPVNTAFKGHQLQHVINSSDVSMLVVDRQFLDRVAFVQDELKSLERLIVFHTEGEKENIPDLRFEQVPFGVLYEGSPSPPGVEVRHTDLMAIMHTSGTTGPSKGVMLCHCHEYNLGWNMAVNARMTPEDVYYNYFPYFHNTAQAIITIATILADASLILRERFSVSAFWEEVRKYNCTVSILMGPMLDMFLKQPEKPDDLDTPLRVAYTLGGKKESYEAFERRFNVVLFEVYGGTEANVVTYNNYDRRKLGSCGTVWPDFEVKIFDEDDNELPPGTTGEIVTRPKDSYIMFLGYYKMEEKTLETYRNLWYHTGDAGYFDEEGYLYFVDRQKDVIRRRMEFISSTDVEDAINSHPSVLESAAVGVPSPEFKGEQEVKVVVVLKEGMKLSPEELISFCEPRMAYFTIPRYVEFKEALPKTPTEKVEKHKLKDEGVTQSTWDREKAGYKIKR